MEIKPSRKGRIDIVAKVFFYPTESGGRKIPLPKTERIGYIFGIHGAFFSGFILPSANEGQINPGDTAIVPMVFLDPITPKALLSIGDRFILRDYRSIGEGEVQEIIDPVPEEKKKEWLRKLKEEDPKFYG